MNKNNLSSWEVEIINYELQWLLKKLNSIIEKFPIEYHDTKIIKEQKWKTLSTEKLINELSILWPHMLNLKIYNENWLYVLQIINWNYSDNLSSYYKSEDLSFIISNLFNEIYFYIKLNKNKLNT